MRSDKVVFPESICALIPMFRIFVMSIPIVPGLLCKKCLCLQDIAQFAKKCKGVGLNLSYGLMYDVADVKSEFFH